MPHDIGMGPEHTNAADTLPTQSLHAANFGYQQIQQINKYSAAVTFYDTFYVMNLKIDKNKQ